MPLTLLLKQLLCHSNMKRTADKLKALTAEKEYLANKKKVLKMFPGSRVMKVGEHFEIVNANGYAVRPNPELNLPKAKSVRQAWMIAAYGLWFDNMIQKSNAAFSEEKIWRQMVKKEERESKPVKEDDYII